MPTLILYRTPFFLGDHWPRPPVSDAQTDPWATAPGSAEVTAVSGPPTRPYRARHDLTVADSAVPPCRRAHVRGLISGRPVPDRKAVRSARFSHCLRTCRPGGLLPGVRWRL
jgi:hypothetical protein